MEQVNRIICIMNYQSSGSCLMSSLLDNHPNLLSTPDDVLGGFQDFWEEHGHLPMDQLVSKFLEDYAMLFDARMKTRGNVYEGNILGLTSMGPDRNEYLEVDRDSFTYYIKELISDVHPVPRKLFFQSLHIAYTKTLGRKVDKPTIVFSLKNLVRQERFNALMEDFSDVKFLMMVRNPVDVVASRFRWQNRLEDDVLRGFGRGLLNAARGGVSDPSTSASRWRAVRMEDLHLDPESTMRKVSNWLKLPWSDSLLESTFNGKKWWNMKGSIQVSGFSSSLASQSFDDYLPAFDRFRLNILLANKCLFWNYEVPWWSNTLIARFLILPFLLIPFKMEFMSLPSIKKNFQENKNESIIKRTLVLLWEIVSGFGRVRVALIHAWFLTFKRSHREVPLL